MIDLASHALGEAQHSSDMLPRRWYADETGPPQHHRMRLTTQTWRYRAITRRQHEDAAPILGAASAYSSSVSSKPSRSISSRASGQPRRLTSQPAASRRAISSISSR